LKQGSVGGWRQVAYAGAGLMLGGLGLYLSLRDVEWNTVWETLRAVRPVWLILAVVCVVGVAWLKAMRWYSLFTPNDRHLDGWSLAAILILAQVVNIVVPLRGSGEMLRIGWVTRRYSINALQVGGTLVVEKLTDLLVLLGIALAVLPWVAQIVGRTVFIFALWLLVAGVLIMTAVVVRFRGAFADRLGRWPLAARYLDQVFGGFSALRSVNSTWELTGWTLAVWVLSFASLFGTLQAAQIAIPVEGGGVLLLLLYLSFLLPTPPGLIGLVQYVCVLVLTFFGVTRDRALGAGIVLHLVLVLPLLALAFPAWLYVGRRMP